mgnify:CR=1 FL=1
MRKFKSNRVTIKRPGGTRKSFGLVHDTTLLDGKRTQKTLKLKARIRYRQPLQDITIHIYRKNIFIEFNKYQTAITSGQFLALYHKNELIASSVIP